MRKFIIVFLFALYFVLVAEGEDTNNLDLGLVPRDQISVLTEGDQHYPQYSLNTRKKEVKKEIVAWDVNAKRDISVFLILLVYSFVTWFLFGRDPKEKDLPYITTPPRDFSPSEIYIFMAQSRKIARSYDDADLVSIIFARLLMLKKVYISSNEGVFKKLTDDTTGLLEEEKKLFDRLPSRSKLGISFYENLRRYVSKIHDSLYEKIKPFVTPNDKFLIIPIITVIVYFVCYSFIAIDKLTGAISVMVYVSLTMAIAKAIKDENIALWSILIALVAFICFYFKIYLFLPYSYRQIITIILLIMTIIYSKAIAKYSPKGVELRNEVNAFKKYILIAEKNRIEKTSPLEEDAIFSKYLPYACAMGIYNEWFEAFTQHINEKFTEIEKRKEERQKQKDKEETLRNLKNLVKGG